MKRIMLNYIISYICFGSFIIGVFFFTRYLESIHFILGLIPTAIFFRVSLYFLEEREDNGLGFFFFIFTIILAFSVLLSIKDANTDAYNYDDTSTYTYDTTPYI